MPYERVEQPLSRSGLENTGVPTPMEIMMIGSSEDICLFACTQQSPGTCASSGAPPSREREPEPQGHVAALKLPRVGSGSPSREDTWRPWSCPQPGGGNRSLNLKLVRGDN
jgi:hypothetical protein